MRAISIACGVALGVVFLFEAMLILATGKTLMFTAGTGGPHFGAWATRAGMVCVVSLVVVVGVSVAAHANPRRYYQLMWWRDLALVVTSVSAVVAVVAVVASQIFYGAL